MADTEQLLLALDLGTTGVRTIAFDQQGQIIAKAYQPLQLFTPQPGWVEQDPQEVWEQTVETLQTVVKKVGEKKVLSLSITNQRESCLLWSQKSGKTLSPIISWQDGRTEKICQKLTPHQEVFKNRTGLFPQPYSTGSKLKWLTSHIDFSLETTKFGTLDTWLLWKLTGGEVFATEPSNASRTLFYNIKTHQYDQYLLDLLGLSRLPMSMLPEVLPSNSGFGLTDPLTTGMSIPIHSILGDQQASLFSHTQFKPGQLKSTYGTGIFVLESTGEKLVPSTHLISTIAGQINDQYYYAVEGSILMGGSLVQWLRDKLQLIDSLAESTRLARTLKGNDGVYCVPAFAGLGAPYWDSHAQGLFTGLSHHTTKAHLVRAALEALVYQTVDVLNQLKKGKNTHGAIQCDGGATVNPFLMQFLADMTGLKIQVTRQTEGTAWGVVGLAGITQQVWTAKQYQAP